MAVVVSRNILKRRCSRMKFLLDTYYMYTAHVSSRLRQLLHRIWVFRVTVVASGHLRFVDSFFRLKSDIFLYGKHSAELITYSRVDRENLDILRVLFEAPIPNRFCRIFVPSHKPFRRTMCFLRPGTDVLVVKVRRFHFNNNRKVKRVTQTCARHDIFEL